MDPQRIRNVAIIAHVDHGKTTLVDRLIYQSGMYRSEDLDKLAGGQHGLILDSNPLERERGITIFSKNCAVTYTPRGGEPHKINIIDTPGHADFGGEVERVLSMANGVLLLVDSSEGPMPQTRFVLEKALAHHLRPIVLINKMDRPDARPVEVLNEVFDLLVELGADDVALDFSVLYASPRQGWAVRDPNDPREDLRPILDEIIARVPPPNVVLDKPLQFAVTSIDYSEFVGRIAIGRVSSGTIRAGATVAVMTPDGSIDERRVAEVHLFEGLGRVRVDEAQAGDLCAVVGVEPIHIGDTIADPDHPVAMPWVRVDEPTLNMTFRINDGPFAGREGTYVTSRQIQQRLDRELLSNVALRVEPGDTAEEFRVSGRGIMHLGILLENMRREGYELCVGMPRVIFRDIDHETCEPIEELVIDCPVDCQSAVIGLLGGRRAEMTRMDTKTGGWVRLVFSVPARGLIGVRERLLSSTGGRAILHHTFLEYQPMRGTIAKRQNGVLVATEEGTITAYALDGLYDRGIFFVKPGDSVYPGQIVGEHAKDNDLEVNVTRAKKFTNIRAAGKDEAVQVRPPRQMSLEAALEYIQEGELVEITPKSIRLRKRMLSESDRRRARRSPAPA